MLGGEAAARDAVTSGGQDRLPLQAGEAPEGEHWQIDLQRGVVAFVDRLGEHDAVDPLLDQMVHGTGDTAGVAFDRVDDAQRVAGAPGRSLERHQQRRGSVQRGAEGDQADPLGAAGDQRPGAVVPAVAEFVHGAQHSVADLVLDVRLTVQHPRDSLLRDTGQPGDICAAGTAGARASWH